MYSERAVFNQIGRSTPNKTCGPHNCAYITRRITLYFLIISAVCYDSSKRQEVEIFEWKRHNKNRAQKTNKLCL